MKMIKQLIRILPFAIGISTYASSIDHAWTREERAEQALLTDLAGYLEDGKEVSRVRTFNNFKRALSARPKPTVRLDTLFQDPEAKQFLIENAQLLKIDAEIMALQLKDLHLAGDRKQ